MFIRTHTTNNIISLKILQPLIITVLCLLFLSSSLVMMILAQQQDSFKHLCSNTPPFGQTTRIYSAFQNPSSFPETLKEIEISIMNNRSASTCQEILIDGSLVENPSSSTSDENFRTVDHILIKPFSSASPHVSRIQKLTIRNIRCNGTDSHPRVTDYEIGSDSSNSFRAGCIQFEGNFDFPIDSVVIENVKMRVRSSSSSSSSETQQQQRRTFDKPPQFVLIAHEPNTTIFTIKSSFTIRNCGIITDAIMPSYNGAAPHFALWQAPITIGNIAGALGNSGVTTVIDENNNHEYQYAVNSIQLSQLQVQIGKFELFAGTSPPFPSENERHFVARVVDVGSISDVVDFSAQTCDLLFTDNVTLYQDRKELPSKIHFQVLYFSGDHVRNIRRMTFINSGVSFAGFTSTTFVMSPSISVHVFATASSTSFTNIGNITFDSLVLAAVFSSSPVQLYSTFFQLSSIIPKKDVMFVSASVVAFDSGLSHINGSISISKIRMAHIIGKSDAGPVVIRGISSTGALDRIHDTIHIFENEIENVKLLHVAFPNPDVDRSLFDSENIGGFYTIKPPSQNPIQVSSRFSSCLIAMMTIQGGVHRVGKFIFERNHVREVSAERSLFGRAQVAGLLMTTNTETDQNEEVVNKIGSFEFRDSSVTPTGLQSLTKQEWEGSSVQQVYPFHIFPSSFSFPPRCDFKVVFFGLADENAWSINDQVYARVSNISSRIVFSNIKLELSSSSSSTQQQNSLETHNGLVIVKSISFYNAEISNVRHLLVEHSIININSPIVQRRYAETSDSFRAVAVEVFTDFRTINKFVAVSFNNLSISFNNNNNNDQQQQALGESLTNYYQRSSLKQIPKVIDATGRVSLSLINSFTPCREVPYHWCTVASEPNPPSSFICGDISQQNEHSIGFQSELAAEFVSNHPHQSPSPSSSFSTFSSSSSSSFSFTNSSIIMNSYDIRISSQVQDVFIDLIQLPQGLNNFASSSSSSSSSLSQSQNTIILKNLLLTNIIADSSNLNLKVRIANIQFLRNIDASIILFEDFISENIVFHTYLDSTLTPSHAGDYEISYISVLIGTHIGNVSALLHCENHRFIGRPQTLREFQSAAHSKSSSTNSLEEFLPDRRVSSIATTTTTTSQIPGGGSSNNNNNNNIPVLIRDLSAAVTSGGILSVFADGCQLENCIKFTLVRLIEESCFRGWKYKYEPDPRRYYYQDVRDLTDVVFGVHNLHRLFVSTLLMKFDVVAWHDRPNTAKQTSVVDIEGIQFNSGIENISSIEVYNVAFSAYRTVQAANRISIKCLDFDMFVIDIDRISVENVIFDFGDHIFLNATTNLQARITTFDLPVMLLHKHNALERYETVPSEPGIVSEYFDGFTNVTFKHIIIDLSNYVQTKGSASAFVLQMFENVFYVCPEKEPCFPQLYSNRNRLDTVIVENCSVRAGLQEETVLNSDNYMTNQAFYIGGQCSLSILRTIPARQIFVFDSSTDCTRIQFTYCVSATTTREIAILNTSVTTFHVQTTQVVSQEYQMWMLDRADGYDFNNYVFTQKLVIAFCTVDSVAIKSSMIVFGASSSENSIELFPMETRVASLTCIYLVSNTAKLVDIAPYPNSQEYFGMWILYQTARVKSELLTMKSLKISTMQIIGGEYHMEQLVGGIDSQVDLFIVGDDPDEERQKRNLEDYRTEYQQRKVLDSKEVRMQENQQQWCSSMNGTRLTRREAKFSIATNPESQYAAKTYPPLRIDTVETGDVKCEFTATKTNYIPPLKSLTSTRTRTGTERTASHTFSEPLPVPNGFSEALTTAANVGQSIGAISAFAVAGMSPAMGFGIARQQAMVNFVQNMRDNKCHGVDGDGDEGVGAADSPTQMSIGSSSARLYVGGAVGNFIITLVFVGIMQAGGALYLKRVRSSSWNKPTVVFARCNVSLVFFVCASILLAPTLTFALVATTQADVPFFEKVVVVIFGILVYGGVTFYYAVWSLFLRTSTSTNNNAKKSSSSLEQYRKVPRDCKSKTASKVRRVFSYWFEGEGEWMVPLSKASPRDRMLFDVATPMIEGYNNNGGGRAKYFGLVEFVSQLLLAMAPFLGNVVPENKSCITVFIVLVLNLSVFLILCVALRPFQELFNRIVTPVITVVNIVIVVLAYGFAENQPAFIVTLVAFVTSAQNAVVVITLAVNFAPLSKHIVRAYKRFMMRKKTDSSGNDKNKSFMPSLQSLLNADDDNERSNQTTKSEEMLQMRRKEKEKDKHDNNPKNERSRSSRSKNHESPSSNSSRMFSPSRRHDDRKHDDQRNNNNHRSRSSASAANETNPTRSSNNNNHRRHSESKDYNHHHSRNPSSNSEYPRRQDGRQSGQSKRPSSTSSSYHHRAHDSSRRDTSRLRDDGDGKDHRLRRSEVRPSPSSSSLLNKATYKNSNTNSSRQRSNHNRFAEI